MTSQWRFAVPPKPEGFQPEDCAGCRDWLREQRDVRSLNAKLARWRSKPRAETPEHTHG